MSPEVSAPGPAPFTRTDLDERRVEHRTHTLRIVKRTHNVPNAVIQTEESESSLGLDEVLRALGNDLAAARDEVVADSAGTTHYGLGVSEAVVDLSVTVTRERDKQGNFGIKWHVISLGGSGGKKDTDSQVHHVTLTLKPVSTSGPKNAHDLADYATTEAGRIWVTGSPHELQGVKLDIGPPVAAGGLDISGTYTGSDAQQSGMSDETPSA